MYISLKMLLFKSLHYYLSALIGVELLLMLFPFCFCVFTVTVKQCTIMLCILCMKHVL